MADNRKIEELSEAEAAMCLIEEASHFLDCAIRLCAHSMELRELVRRLRAEADNLELYE